MGQSHPWPWGRPWNGMTSSAECPDAFSLGGSTTSGVRKIGFLSLSFL